jgi:hypothetical protein
MVDKAEPISLSGLGYGQSGVCRDQSGLGQPKTTREVYGNWLSPDWALVWHHTENRDQTTTLVVGHPDIYVRERRKRIGEFDEN